MDTSKTDYKPLIAVAVFVVLVVGAIIYKTSRSSQNNTQTVMVAKPTSTVATYKDGTYTAEGDYMVHVGPKHISVKLTLKNDIVTDANVTNEADDRMSVRYQDMFISGYKEFVIGKKITDIHLTKISGSSLTPAGFNDALQKIETQAKG